MELLVAGVESSSGVPRRGSRLLIAMARYLQLFHFARRSQYVAFHEMKGISPFECLHF
jgi:hypothetical protein